MVWHVIVIAIIAYLIGSISPAIILCKLLKKGDIREQGSGNAGSTNVLRVLGKGPALIVLIFDILKAVVAVLLGLWIAQLGSYTPEEFAALHDYAIMAASFGVILGHNYPIYFGFKGGKGVAVSIGIILVVEWKIGLICILYGTIIMLLTRMVSLGSILSAILYPLLVFIIGGSAFNNKWLYIIFALVLMVSVLIRHRSNIKRIYDGTENKIWLTKAEKKKAKLK